MWGKVPETVKCPRNDCKHYDCKPNEYPCKICTCNRRSDPFGRSFRFQREGGDFVEDRKRTEAGMAEQGQASASASGKPAGCAPGEIEPG